MPPKTKPSFEETFGQHMSQAFEELNLKLGSRFDKIDENLAIVNNDLTYIKDHLIKKLLEENQFLRSKVD